MPPETNKCTNKHVNTRRAVSDWCQQTQCRQVPSKGHKGSLGPMPAGTQHGLVWWPEFRRQRQLDCKFKAILGFLKKSKMEHRIQLFDIWAFIQND